MWVALAWIIPKFRLIPYDCYRESTGCDLAKPGDFDQVTFRDSEDRRNIEILDAEIMAIDTFKGLPIFRLHVVNGTPLLQGDSGEGVWFNGKVEFSLTMVR